MGTALSGKSTLSTFFKGTICDEDEYEMYEIIKKAEECNVKFISTESIRKIMCRHILLETKPIIY